LEVVNDAELVATRFYEFFESWKKYRLVSIASEKTLGILPREASVFFCPKVPLA
jgi:hypothetical protein